MIRREGEIRLHDTHVAVWEEDVDEEAMLAVWMSVRAHLERRGFALGPVESVVRISEAHAPKGKRARERDKPRRDAWIESYRYGRKCDLELQGETHGRMLKVEFFQNVANVENRNGGQYDFRKFLRMPRALRLRCAVEMVALIRHLQSFGYALGRDLSEPLMASVIRVAEGRAEEGLAPLERFNRSWGADRFTRGPDGWPTPQECNGYGRAVNLDRDRAPLAPGDVRAVYHAGRLVQGRVYPGMGNMWTLSAADGSWLAKENADRFFTPTADTPRRKPLTKQQRVAKLDATIRRALLRDDARRADSARAALAKLTSERMYYVLSLAHSKAADGVLTWWGPNASGYVFRLEQAGRYLESTIAADRSCYDNGERSRAIPCEVVEAPARTVREVSAAAVDREPTTDRVVRYRHKGALKRWRPASAATEAA